MLGCKTRKVDRTDKGVSGTYWVKEDRGRVRKDEGEGEKSKRRQIVLRKLKKKVKTES